MLIQPGQKISYDAKTGKSKVEEVDIEREIGWKDGKLFLKIVRFKKHLISYLKIPRDIPYYQ